MTPANQIIATQANATQANATQGSASQANATRVNAHATQRVPSLLARVAGSALVALLAACGSSSNNSTSSSPAAGSTASAPRSAEAASAGSLTEQAVTQINAIRASARNCGGISFAAAGPVAANTKLESAASLQAQYMQSTNTLTHLGSGNSSIGDRVTSAGYVWSAAGENVAVGYDTLADVLQGWVESPGHCANLMNAAFADVGIAQSAGAADSYWALTLAKPAN